MPTYEYECQSCGHRFEAFQSMSDEPLTECENCKGPVKRLIFGGTGIIFKGSGFYVNDSAKAGKQSTQASKSGNTEHSEKTSASDNKKSSEKKVETKSDSSKSKAAAVK
ncbi:MAG: zinc ribbon domain-containing protein [Spirochaetales bacterium]|nr:zinc ribbon domain-containing protein [Spirochaetales bacterium]